MGGSEIRSSEAQPFRVVPESGQVSKNISKPERKVAWHVFQERVSGSKYANETVELRPKMPRVIRSSALSGLTERLARVSSTDEVNSLEFVSNGSDVSIALYPRPVFRQNLQTERVDFNLPAALHPGALKSQIQTANSRKKRAER
jgi:hypothetical protein